MNYNIRGLNITKLMNSMALNTIRNKEKENHFNYCIVYQSTENKLALFCR